MPPKRMTANPVRPARYRPGKAAAEQASSSEESGEESEQEQEAQAPVPKQPPPKATSFPADAKKIASNLKNVDLNERRRQAEAQEKARKAREQAERTRAEKEAGFVTESESGSEDDEEEEEEIVKKDYQISKPTVISRRPAAGSSESSDEEDDSDSDTSSSASSAPKLLRPVFIRKDQRNKPAVDPAAAQAEADAARRAAEAEALVQEKLERDVAARAAGKKNWDDDDPDVMDIVDDTDGLDPELERQQWVARELSRLKRARAALEEREAELAEIERRKNLTPAEREAEDREHVSKQQEEKAGRDKAGFMQRYHHKGAFYTEEGEANGLAERNLMGANYANAEGIRETLPEYLQVRDVTKIGRKGRTKYKDMRTEDTGRWGDFAREERGVGYERKRDDRKDVPFSTDDRFRPDRPGGGLGGGTGANASAVGDKDRKRPYQDGKDGDAKRARYGD